MTKCGPARDPCKKRLITSQALMEHFSVGKGAAELGGLGGLDALFLKCFS